MICENPTVSGMAEVLSPKSESSVKQGVAPGSNRPTSLSRSLFFKYYIHDSVSTLRFQLIGDLRTANVSELNGSWQTASTTLTKRRFLLDVAQLYSTDDQGHAWLARMKDLGADFHPANYLDSRKANSLVQPIPETLCAVKLSILGRVMGLFRS